MDNGLNIKEKEFLGSGWAFPVTFSAGNYELELSRYEENIKDSINIIVQTRLGERVTAPQFGSGLQQFFFKTMTQTLKSEVRETLKTALLDNEPRITVFEIEVDFVDPQTGLLEVLIDYKFNKTNTRHNYVFPFYIKEGTNLGQ